MYAGAAGNTQEADRALERKNNQRQQQHYLIYEEKELSLNADGGYIEAHSRGKVRMPDMGWQQVLSGENFLSLEAGSRIQKLEPGSFLRACRQIIESGKLADTER